MKSVNEIESFCDGIGQRKRKGIAVKKRTLYAFAIVTSVILAVTVSSALLNYFVRVEANIDVDPVLECDGTSCPILIYDNFSAMACNQTIVQHNMTNLHDTKDIDINFTILNDDGLTIDIRDNDTLNWITAGSFTIPANDYKLIDFYYNVSCYADPEVDLTGSVEIQFAGGT